MPDSHHRVLLDPATYPERSGGIDFRETHISTVYLTEMHAYKFKKPLDLGFLDFRTLEKRRHFCHEEVRLNKRFCNDIYLDVVSLNKHGESFKINGPGETVDYAVMMRRLPENRMLDSLLRGSQSTELVNEIDRLGDKLKEIYPTLPTSRSSNESDHLEMVRTNWQENFDQTRPYIGRTINRDLFELGRQKVETFLNDYAPALKQRENKGFVRDCHGDLHSRNICMTENICIYDCIEFNRRFRIGDIAGDIAFLLMDLDFRGHHGLSERLLDKVKQILGPEEETAELIPFYKFYRAWVRGKVESFLLDEENIEEDKRRDAGQTASRYFNLAFGLLAPPGLILTCGLMGTGKTTVARALAAATGATLLRSDVIRKEIFGLDSSQSATADFNEGLYTEDKTERTYEELWKRAKKTIEEDRPVIVDASFRKSSNRKEFEDLASRCEVPFLILHVDCPADLALSRLDRREREESDASDARRELYRQQANAFEKPSGKETKIDVDTSQEVDYNVSLILSQYLKMTGTR